MPGIRGTVAQLYRVLQTAEIPIEQAKGMTFTEVAIALGRDISFEDRLMLQSMHHARREYHRTGVRTSTQVPEIQQTTVRDASGTVRRFEKGVAAD